MPELRWGICSAGKICQDFAHAVSLLKNHKLQAIGARSREDAEKLAKAVGAESVHEGYEQLAADPNVDIVYVGAINIKHLPLCKLFLEAKKHVLCEKPLALHAREVEAIIDSARKNGCFFMEGLWSRFLPSYEKVRSLIAEGEIGEVKFMTGNYCFAGIHAPHVYNRDIGGGPMYSFGVYLIQLATMIMGPEPTVVQGVGGLTHTGVDEVCSISLVYPGNRVCSMVTGVTASGDNEATIFGTKGRIKLICPVNASTSVELTREGPSRGQVSEKLVFDCPLPETDHKFNFANTIGLQYEAEAVRKAIEEGKQEHPLVPWLESLAICRIMDKLRHDVGYYRPDEDGPAKS